MISAIARSSYLARSLFIGHTLNSVGTPKLLRSQFGLRARSLFIGHWALGIGHWVLGIGQVVILPCNTAISMGRTNTTWKSGSTWNGGETTTIRVPIVLKDDILAYARAVDSKLITDKSRNIPLLPGDFLQEFTLGLIESYIEFKRHNYHPNQNSRTLDTSTRAWDELRKFQRLIQESPQLLRD